MFDVDDSEEFVIGMPVNEVEDKNRSMNMQWE